MIAELRVRAANSVLLIADPTAQELPATMGGLLVAATSGCIAIGTLAEFDGETRVRLLTWPDQAERTEHPELSPVFSGPIATPSGQVAVMTVLGELLVGFSIGVDSALIDVLVNDPTEPDEIVVVVQPGDSD